MNLNYYKYLCLSLVSLLIVGQGAIAQDTAKIVHQQGLNIRDSNIIYLSRNNSNEQEQTREYTFKAPGNKTLSNTEHLAAGQGYKVEVYGNASELLLQVRDIEPKAFIKGDVIQVGIFSQQDNAEDIVRQLAKAGFWARIIAQ
ncbi:MAG: SPOR domain-containing protein [Cyanobacteria bacterium P01_G01_bin.39]